MKIQELIKGGHLLAYKSVHLNAVEIIGSQLPILPPYRGLNIRGELNKRLSKPLAGKPFVWAMPYRVFEKIKEIQNDTNGKASR